MIKKDNLLKMKLMIGTILVGNAVLLSMFPFFGVQIQETADEKFSFILLVEILIQVVFFIMEQMRHKLNYWVYSLLQISICLCSIIAKIEIITQTFLEYKGIMFYCFVQLFCNSLQLFEVNMILSYILFAQLYIGIKFEYFEDPIYSLFFFQLILMMLMIKKIVMNELKNHKIQNKYKKSQYDTLLKMVGSFQDCFCILQKKNSSLSSLFVSNQMSDQFKIADKAEINNFLQNLSLVKSNKNIYQIIDLEYNDIIKNQHYEYKSQIIREKVYLYRQNLQQSLKEKTGNMELDLEYHDNKVQQKWQCQNNIKIVFVYILKQIYILLLFDNQPQQLEIHVDQSSLIKTLKDQIQHKDHILASVTHDFKTPLNGMIALIEYLETQHHQQTNHFSNDLNQEQKQYLKIIKKNSYLILFMVHDIADLARIQNNKFELCYTQFDIQEIVNEVIDLLILQCQQKGIELYQKSNLIQSVIVSDQNRIKQILLNLISNAMKFTLSGSITIKLSDHVESFSLNQQKVIKISVIDTGSGMCDSIKNNLFQNYATFDQNGMNKHGVGLGLVICQKLASQLGPCKNIDVESQVGQGSTFTFYITSNDSHDHNQFFSYKYIEQISSQGQDRKSIRSNRNSANQRFSFQQLIVNSNILVRSSIMPQLDNSKLIYSDDFSDSMLEDKESQKNIKLQKNRQNKTQIDNLNIRVVEEEQQINHTQILNQEKIFHTQPPQLFSFAQQIESVNRWEHEDICLPKNCGILVVDDEPFNILAVKVIFKSFPWIKFEEAYNGEQAIQKLKQNRNQFQYVLMDLTMPIMNGYQAAKQIKKLIVQKELPPLKIIALTGYNSMGQSSGQSLQHFDAFISKPLSKADILETLKLLNL